MTSRAEVQETSKTPMWHALAAADVLSRQNSNSAKGLDSAEASRRLEKYGPNRLPAGTKRGPLMRFLLQFDNILVYVLIAAGFVKLMLGLWLDASIITGVVVINALLGFLQEGKAEKALESIRDMLSADARTLRGGETRIVPAEELVPGDIVLLELGDKIPADLRLVDVKNLRTEEAALTGESVPAEKSAGPVAQNATVGDRDNMAFSGTLVVSGRASGVVIATGAETELGRINQMLAGVSPLETPLLRQIKEFGHTIAKVIGFVSVVMFAYGRWVRGLPFVEMFQAVVSIAVSVIPEGLPALITITLAIGVQRMAQRNAIIRRLPAVETLGSISRICSDKTGTLTLMEMMVASAVTAEADYTVSGEGYASAGEILREGKRAGEDPILHRMGLVSVHCNDAELRQAEGVWKVEGDPTEAALYPFAAKLGLDRQAERNGRRRIDAIPFESEHKFMATLHAASDGEQVLFVKGAPEVILDHCDRQETGSGQSVPLIRAHWTEASDRLAAQGERVLALAWLPKPGLSAGSLGPADLPGNLVLLGLVGLMDPPRKEAIEAVAECHNGGIRVTMITGDHKITAAAIAKMLGIGDGKTAIAGVEIEKMNDGELQQQVRDVDVFARASPEHKLRLVKAIQANGQIVAMTGDGVNDAPALKKADIGVAMGIKGTEVTKEAAAMVLADDNFASITAAVREGRTVYNNIEKALLFMLPTNVAQALVIMVAIIIGFALPITAPQILWVNMVTSVALGLVISFEPHEPDVMQRLPRAVSRPILDGFAIWRVVFVGLALLALTLGAFFWMKSKDASDELARAVAVNTLVIGQVFYLLNSRFKTDSSLSIRAHLGNRYLPLGVGAVVLLQLAFTYAPPLQRLFGTEAVPLNVWPWLLLGGFLFFLVVEAEKFVIRRLGSSRHVLPRVVADEFRQSVEATSDAGVGSQPESTRNRGMSGQLWQGALGALAVLALAGGEIWSWRQGGADRYATETVGQRVVTHGAAATGVINPGRLAQIGALISGKIEAVHCDADAKVKAGQLCAKIDPLPYQAVVDREETILAAAQSRRDKSAASLARLKADFERKQELATRGGISRSAFEKSRADYESARARATADEAAIASVRTALDAAEADLAHTEILSPVSGTIISRNVEIGRRVEAGKGPPLFVVAPDLTIIQIGATVGARDVGEIKLGDKVSFTVDTFPDRIFAGEVSNIGQSRQTTKDAPSYDILIAAPNPDLSLKTGMRVTGKILIDRP